MHPEEKIRTTIDIFGTTYKMVGTYSQSYMKRISAYVNENMESIAKSNPRLDFQKVAVLALIQMADEHFRLQAQWNAFESEHSQSKQRIEELRKAFELTEEKERGQSALVAQLQERIDALEAENARLADEKERGASALAAQLQERIDALEAENLRLAEEKARSESALAAKLEQRIRELETENLRISEESELASLAWAERVEEWEVKYGNAVRESEAAVAALGARVAELEAERSQREAAAAAAEAPKTVAPPTVSAAGQASDAEAGDPSLEEKYNKLQEEYVKLQNEFNEWIQLTQMETQ